MKKERLSKYLKGVSDSLNELSKEVIEFGIDKKSLDLMKTIGSNLLFRGVAIDFQSEEFPEPSFHAPEKIGCGKPTQYYRSIVDGHKQFWKCGEQETYPEPFLCPECEKKRESEPEEICECGHHTRDHSYNPDWSTNLRCDICDCKELRKKSIQGEICECGHFKSYHNSEEVEVNGDYCEVTGCFCTEFRKKSKSETNHSPYESEEQRVYESDPSSNQTEPMKSDKGVGLGSADTSKSTDEKCKEEFDKDYDKKT